MEARREECRQPTGEYSGGRFLICILADKELIRKYRAIDVGEDCESYLNIVFTAFECDFHKLDNQVVIYESGMKKQSVFYEEILKRVILSRLYDSKTIENLIGMYKICVLQCISWQKADYGKGIGYELNDRLVYKLSQRTLQTLRGQNKEILYRLPRSVSRLLKCICIYNVNAG